VLVPVSLSRGVCGPARRGRVGRCSVAQGVEGNLHAFQQFLDDDLAADRAEFLSEHDLINRRGGLQERRADDDALAQRQAVGFDGATAVEGRGKIPAGPAWEKVPARAVGMPYFSMNCWEKTLEDSNRAAFWFGPQMRRELAWNKSTMPSASGLSGPTTVRAALFFPREGEQGGQIVRGNGGALHGGGRPAPGIRRRCRDCPGRTIIL